MDPAGVFEEVVEAPASGGGQAAPVGGLDAPLPVGATEAALGEERQACELEKAAAGVEELPHGVIVGGCGDARGEMRLCGVALTDG